MDYYLIPGPVFMIAKSSFSAALIQLLLNPSGIAISLFWTLSWVAQQCKRVGGFLELENAGLP